MMPMARALHKAPMSEDLPRRAWGLPTVGTRGSSVEMLCQTATFLSADLTWPQGRNGWHFRGSLLRPANLVSWNLVDVFLG